MSIVLIVEALLQDWGIFIQLQVGDLNPHQQFFYYYIRRQDVSNSLLECLRKLDGALVRLAQVLWQVDQQSPLQPNNPWILYKSH